jgi:alpha-methylacyl-CoA racemase
MGPLTGIRVVEFAGIGPTPFAAMLLSDLGAEVLRIDRPAGAAAGGHAGMASLTEGVLTRGRPAVGIDVKDADGLAAAQDLVAGADALVEGFRPGVMERLGLGPDACLERNPRLVYGRISGWGREGPYAQAPGHDLNYIALAGVLAHIGRRDERPVAPLNVLADFAGGGMLLALGMAAALVESSRSGRGQVVDTAMVDGAAYLSTMMYELLGKGSWDERREANPNDGGAHFYDVYETADGKYVSVAAMEPKFYAALLDRLGLSGEDLPEQWDPAAWPQLKERFAGIFRRRTRDEWSALLEGTEACFAPVLTMSEALVHPHNVHRQMFVEVDGVMEPAPAPRFSRTPTAVRGDAAASDLAAVLTGWGLPRETVERLRETTPSV